MEFYHNYLESFEITGLIEKYEGKTLKDLFNNRKVISNGMGEFLEIFWECDDISPNIDITKTKRNIVENLKTVYYVGEVTEKNLKRRGVKTLYDLRSNLKFRDSTNQILELIKHKDHIELCNNKQVYDLDVLFCFSKEDLIFFDIETMGLYDSPIIIVGIGYYTNNKYIIQQYFARGLEEEIAICEHLRNKVFPKFKCFVSYNGKSFDIPYLANRFLYYFDENPMIHDDLSPYKNSNTKFGHIDLYHNCRRKYKGVFQSYNLTTMEEELLNWKRENELPSNLVSVCYKKYLEDPKKYIGLIKECIDHNYYDIMSLPLILMKLLED
ncbi:MAG: hypothetical protein GF317_14715 [Candidatus Lokiarchaeota archaeon]|nr:hypothetical protein [Candidatus Lokiarchaeota archaeon]MBD3200860.1 hypothetical protein [Candidatus Lokiarchaeota archaeon]